MPSTSGKLSPKRSLDTQPSWSWVQPISLDNSAASRSVIGQFASTQNCSMSSASSTGIDFQMDRTVNDGSSSSPFSSSVL